MAAFGEASSILADADPRERFGPLRVGSRGRQESFVMQRLLRVRLLVVALVACGGSVLTSPASAQVRAPLGGNNLNSQFNQQGFGIGQNNSGGGFGAGQQQPGMQQGGLQQGGLQQGGLQQGPGGQRGFVGNDAQDAQGMFQNLNGRDRRRAMFDFALDSLNEMRDQRRRWQERQRQPPPARVALVPEIDVASPSPAITAGAVDRRLTDVLSRRGVATPEIEIVGRTVTLRGTVATEHDKLLVGKLASIEPGVSEVENLLSVQDDLSP